ncbi:TlpA family protein disulfide reductase [Flavobacterium litorale]|uniref:T9SS type A sorting domain-containing protein n=1 Tax=Flavobacterium litorale TaxID=2856519 RepID=A0ABX8V8W0_9FLAO|nr:T9SS type A sorting domain-containing protein [Flavobacterium litorale]QYJ69277.1 T9SS type A sorting domain-containing protein [Flavobacterium litorale]
MKKRLLLGILALAGFSANAQLASGSQAPDFTATDINGVEHHLQTYLDQGKTVIMDVSATWCGPCWGFHSKHVLDDLHKAYGPAGSDEIVVLFVEGDGSTGMADLNGETDSSQGDWVTGTSYPIIDSATISNQYSIAYFPTLYRICPNGLVYEMSILNTTTAATLMADINQCSPVNGLDKHAEIKESTVGICDVVSTSNFDVEVKNYGNETITNAEVSLNYDGNVVATETFNINLATFASANLSFEGVELDSNKEYTVELNQINGSTPSVAELAVNNLSVVAAPPTDNNFGIHVYTDNYPAEITWDVKDSNGDIVASGGPYQAGPGTAGAGGPDANTVKMYTVNVPEGTSDCYEINMYDSYGDGWSLSTNQNGIEIVSGGEVVASYLVRNFGTEVKFGAAFTTNGVLSTPAIETSRFSVYPNPSNGIFNFETQETIAVTVMDLTGKVVYSAKEINNGDVMNLSNLQSGMYIAKIVGATAERTEKLVIK